MPSSTTLPGLWAAVMRRRSEVNSSLMSWARASGRGTAASLCKENEIVIGVDEAARGEGIDTGVGIVSSK